MTDSKMNVEHRTLVIKAGMTPQDVIKSDKATAEQKKMAFVFDSDGVAGYSQREADVFNATLIADHGKQGISLWTRYEDDSRKETKFIGDVTSFKYAPKGDVKPYTVKKGTQTKAVQTTQTKTGRTAQSTPKEKPLPPLTQVVGLDTLTYYSKQDSIAFNKKEDAAYAKYEAADRAGYAKYEAVDRAGYTKYEAADRAAYAKFKAADGSLKSKAYDEWRNSSAKAYDEWENSSAKAYDEWENSSAKAYDKWQATIKQAQQEHCSQVKKYKHE